MRADDESPADVRKRIQMILRGPSLGVPLWVPRRVMPCSLCLKLVNYRKFHTRTRNRRVEPVCDDCRGIKIDKELWNGPRSG
jgi:hypothetical protein